MDEFAFHDRLTKVEQKLDTIARDMSRIAVACTGNEDGSRRGYNMRLDLLERFKKSVTWALGILYIAVVTGAIGTLFWNIRAGLK